MHYSSQFWTSLGAALLSPKSSLMRIKHFSFILHSIIPSNWKGDSYHLCTISTFTAQREVTQSERVMSSSIYPSYHVDSLLHISPTWSNLDTSISILDHSGYVPRPIFIPSTDRCPPSELFFPYPTYLYCVWPLLLLLAPDITDFIFIMPSSNYSLFIYFADAYQLHILAFHLEDFLPPNRSLLYTGLLFQMENSAVPKKI